MIEVYFLFSIFNSQPDYYSVRDYKTMEECSLAIKMNRLRDTERSWRYLCKKVTLNTSKNNPFENEAILESGDKDNE